MDICLAGLSPLARGTLVGAELDGLLARFIPAGAGNTAAGFGCQPLVRFIPAGAGNTPYSVLVQGEFAVYPRWRGEHFFQLLRAGDPPGLSPLARGTRSRSDKAVKARRFIPAGAGNTPKAKATERAIAVYPRWRGEHAAPVSVAVNVIGLSPLARGTRRAKGCRRKDFRFIPAGAGNTSTYCR